MIGDMQSIPRKRRRLLREPDSRPTLHRVSVSLHGEDPFRWKRKKPDGARTEDQRRVHDGRLRRWYAPNVIQATDKFPPGRVKALNEASDRSQALIAEARARGRLPQKGPRPIAAGADSCACRRTERPDLATVAGRGRRGRFRGGRQAASAAALDRPARAGRLDFPGRGGVAMTEFWQSAVFPYWEFWSLIPALILLAAMCEMYS